MEVIKINTIDDAKKHLFFHQEYQEAIGRHRTLYVYRGLPDVNFELYTSLQRVCKNKKGLLEEPILNNFAKYAEIENSSINQSIWRKMIIGQHHGLPTRLLDWSMSPLMALHFAMTEGDMNMMDKRDCVLWRINIKKFNRLLPERYQKELERTGQNVFTVDMLQNVCTSLSTYDEDMKADSMVMMEPPTIDLRIANQYSVFSIVPSNVRVVEDILDKCSDGVTKYIIDKNIRWEIRDMLDKANINERIVYPGLDGIATWLGRYYFVRDISRLEILCRSVTDLEADVIVDPINSEMMPHGAVNESIFYKAGKEALMEACKSHAPAAVGELVETEAFALKADRIYHVVGQKWNKEQPEQSEAELAALYRKVLERLKEKDLHSVAFPLIGRGYQHYPAEIAWRAGLRECRSFQEENPGFPIQISFCVLEAAEQVFGKEILDVIDGKIQGVSDDYLYLKNSGIMNRTEG